jgi:hypothetical protein
MFESADPSPIEIEIRKLAFGKQPQRVSRLKQLERWAQVRRNNTLIKAPKNTHRLKVCACGGLKDMSANRCHACQEARRIILSKTPPLTSYFDDKRLTRTEMRQCKLPVEGRANKEPIAFEQNNSFDDIVKLYEDCQ